MFLLILAKAKKLNIINKSGLFRKVHDYHIQKEALWTSPVHVNIKVRILPCKIRIYFATFLLVYNICHENGEIS